MSATRTLAQFIVDTRYDTLSAAVVDAAKIAILDGVATMLGGSTQDLAAIIGQYVRKGRGHSGPVPQSGLDGKFSVECCAAAALLDGRVVIDSFTDQRRFSPDTEETPEHDASHRKIFRAK